MCAVVRTWRSISRSMSASDLKSSQRPSILLRMTRRPDLIAASSPARCWFHTSRSVLVTPASAARMNRTACAFGRRLSVSSGSVPIAFKPGVSRIDEALLQEGMREVDDGVPPAGDVHASLVAVLERRQDVVLAVAVEPVLARELDRDALDLRHPRHRLAHLVRGREVERERHPLVGVVLVLRDRRVLEARLDGQEPDRRRARRVVQELGRAHRRASRRRGQEPLAEVREEDGVDELGLAARELRDEGDDELVLVQPLEELLDPQVDLGVGQVLVLHPVVHRQDARGQPAPPVAVRLETRGKIAGWDHVVPLRFLYRTAPISGSGAKGRRADCSRHVKHNLCRRCRWARIARARLNPGATWQITPMRDCPAASLRGAAAR